MFNLKPSSFENEMPGIRWQGEPLCASQFGDSEFMAACEGIGRFSRESLLRIWNTYVDNKLFMTGSRRSGEPNWHHPVGVALVGMLEFGNTDPDSVIADLMHDAKEDCPIFQGHKNLVGEYEFFQPIDMLTGRYGERVAKIVMAVSKPPRAIPKQEMDVETNERYLRFVYNRIINLYPEVRVQACQTKVRDRIFNTRTENDEARMARNLLETARYITPLAKVAGSDYEDAIHDIIKKHNGLWTPEQRKLAVTQEFNIE